MGYENGLIVSITDSEGATTNYNYDQLGQLTTFYRRKRLSNKFRI